MTKQQMPYGISGFELLRKHDYLYVDKTELIYKLTRFRQPILLSRPRRFGKTLLISTLSSLFAQGTAYFKGLKIEKLWQDEPRYKVLRLDFSELSFNAPHAVDLSAKLLDYINGYCRAGGIIYDESATTFAALFLDITMRPENPNIVLLIDEYDHPLTECLNHPEDFAKIQSVLREFYLVVKRHAENFRFIFITGVVRFAPTSICSGLNNLYDISCDAEFGTLLGFTQEEILATFQPQISDLAGALQIDEKQVVNQLKHHYDGYSFELYGRNRVYNPWSIMICLTKISAINPFQAWWVNSGGISRYFHDYFEQQVNEKGTLALLKIIEDPAAAFPVEPSELGLFSMEEGCKINPTALLLLAGYLTFKPCENDGLIRIGVPNWEVRQFLSAEFARWIATKQGKPPRS